MEKADYKLLLSWPTGLTASQVCVIFDQLYDRIPHPDGELEKSIAKIWDQRVQKNASLFNGKKFRYGGYSLLMGDRSDQDALMCLHLGLTNYRTFVGTNLNPSWEKFLAASEDDVVKCQHTSSPLGNGTIVETLDKRIVVLQRSQNVGEFPGYYVFPGGHPEPENVGVALHQSGEESIEHELINRKVSEEIFDSVLREVVEEIGVPWTSVCSSLFIGVTRRVLNVRPVAFFFVKCILPSKDIQQLYSSAQDGFESTQLYTVTMYLESCGGTKLVRSDILMQSEDWMEYMKDDLESMVPKMPGCHQGGFALYKMMVEASESF